MLNSQAGENVIKDGFFGFERLKVDNNSHGRGSIEHFLVAFKALSRTLSFISFL